MRSPCSFILRSACVVTGLRSSAMGHRRRFELGDLTEPEVAMRKLGVWEGELKGAHRTVAEPYDVEVQGAGPPAHVPLPASLGFHRPALPQQLGSREPGFEER